MTPEGAARQKSAGGTYVKQTGFASASELGPYDRCISRGVVGSMMPVVYNNGNEIIQSPGFVAFRNEMIHEVRIIPLDGRGPLPAGMKSYMGSSRGRWEGNTLVVRTTNLNGKTGMQGNGMMLIPSDSLVLEERFTPVSPTCCSTKSRSTTRRRGPRRGRCRFRSSAIPTTRFSSTRVTRGTTRCGTSSRVREPTNSRAES